MTGLLPRFTVFYCSGQIEGARQTVREFMLVLNYKLAALMLVNSVLFGVSFVHAVLHERPAVISRYILLVGEVLADVRLVLLTHFIKLLISSFLEAVLYEIFAIVSLQAFVISHIVAGFGL